MTLDSQFALQQQQQKQQQQKKLQRPERPTTLCTTPREHVFSQIPAHHFGGNGTKMGSDVSSAASAIGSNCSFNENDEWAKISEIMATFGINIVSTDDTNSSDLKGDRHRSSSRIAPQTITAVEKVSQKSGSTIIAATEMSSWLRTAGLPSHLQSILCEHGFDNVNFMVSLFIFHSVFVF